jgi:predicted SnoaL-like aldol condensation-catalyzing enzyme
MTEGNLELASRFFEDVFNQGKLEIVDKLFDPSHTFHFLALPEEQSSGLDIVKDVVSLFFDVSPIFKVVIEDNIAQDDKVVIRWTGRGYPNEEIRNAISTDDQVAVAGCNIFRIEDNLITETWLFLEPHREESEWPVLRPEVQELFRTMDRRAVRRMDDETEIKVWCLIYPPQCQTSP